MTEISSSNQLLVDFEKSLNFVGYFPVGDRIAGVGRLGLGTVELISGCPAYLTALVQDCIESTEETKQSLSKSGDFVTNGLANIARAYTEISGMSFVYRLAYDLLGMRVSYNFENKPFDILGPKEQDLVGLEKKLNYVGYFPVGSSLVGAVRIGYGALQFKAGLIYAVANAFMYVTEGDAKEKELYAKHAWESLTHVPHGLASIGRGLVELVSVYQPFTLMYDYADEYYHPGSRLMGYDCEKPIQ